VSERQSAESVRRLAYADPPYLGCCGRYGHRHDEPWGCWDDPATHEALIRHLSEFDGWAMSGTSGSLRTLLPMLPDDVRVAAWVKPWCSFKTANPAYAWEPVLFRSARGWKDRGGRTVLTVRDWLAESVTLRKPVIGAKPERFCRWVLDLMGHEDGDELVDIFPGSGVMDRVVAQRRLAI
jgi:hypothetical protein